MPDFLSSTRRLRLKSWRTGWTRVRKWCHRHNTICTKSMFKIPAVVSRQHGLNWFRPICVDQMSNNFDRTYKFWRKEGQNLLLEAVVECKSICAESKERCHFSSSLQLPIILKMTPMTAIFALALLIVLVLGHSASAVESVSDSAAARFPGCFCKCTTLSGARSDCNSFGNRSRCKVKRCCRHKIGKKCFIKGGYKCCRK